jgi:hypothetical protein
MTRNVSVDGPFGLPRRARERYILGSGSVNIARCMLQGQMCPHEFFYSQCYCLSATSNLSKYGMDGVRETIGQGIKSKIPTNHFFKRIGHIPREWVRLYLCD